jgi:hypothetical protein
VLEYENNILFLKHKLSWFSPTAPSFSPFSLEEHRQCFENAKRPLYTRTQFHTIVIDLKQDMSEILSDFNSTTRAKVRRAGRNGTEIAEITDFDFFVDFYNNFASSKSDRSAITRNDFSKFLDNIVIRQALLNGKTMVIHSYIVDREIGYARLLHSASHYRSFEDRSQRNSISIANCYLHFADIEYFKEHKFKCYDLGGIPSPSSFDEELNKIAQFKRGFGGIEVTQSNYTSFNLVAMYHSKLAIGNWLSCVANVTSQLRLSKSPFRRLKAN